MNCSDKEDFEQKLKQIEENSEKRIREIQDQFQKLQDQLLLASGRGKHAPGPSGKGKGPQRGKSSTVTTTRSSRGAVQEYFGDLDDQSHISVTSDASTSESFVQIGASASNFVRPEQRESAVQGDEFEEHTVYLKKVELTLNGSPIDMIEDRQTEDHCIQSFWKMNQA